MTYKSPEQVNKDFDEQFPPIEFCHIGEDKMTYVEDVRNDIKSYITSIRTADLQSIREWAEEKKTYFKKATGTTDSALYATGIVATLTDLLSHLSTLSSSSEKGTPPYEIKE